MADETKAQKFKRVAAKRMDKALNAISILGNLGNRALYDYTEDHVSEMTAALETAVEDVLNRLSNPSTKKKTGFCFS